MMTIIEHNVFKLIFFIIFRDQSNTSIIIGIIYLIIKYNFLK